MVKTSQIFNLAYLLIICMTGITQVGRLVAALEERGELENTLFFYTLGDTGSSAEGGMVGLYNENTFFNRVPETLETQLEKIVELREMFNE